MCLKQLISSSLSLGELLGLCHRAGIQTWVVGPQSPGTWPLYCMTSQGTETLREINMLFSGWIGKKSSNSILKLAVPQITCTKMWGTHISESSEGRMIPSHDQSMKKDGLRVGKQGIQQWNADNRRENYIEESKRYGGSENAKKRERYKREGKKSTQSKTSTKRIRSE